MYKLMNRILKRKKSKVNIVYQRENFTHQQKFDVKIIYNI